jgi:hypothetical protein
LKLIPDPYGVNDPELKFMRAKTARDTRRFIDAPPLGENMLRQIIPRLNELLPGDLRLAKATAHSGRHTSASIAVNSGVDPITVSKVTKHKDPKTLKKYIHEDIGQKMTTASMIGKRVSANMSTIETAGDIEEASEEEVEHIKKKRSYSDDDDDVISGRKAGIHHLW